MPAFRINAGNLVPANTKVYPDETCLAEDFVNASTKELWFPRVGSCIVVVGCTPKTLVGAHLTCDTAVKEVEAILKKMRELAGKDAFSSLYVLGNFTVWASMTAKIGKNSGEIVKSIKKTLDHKGNTYTFDSAGTVTKELPHACFRATFSGTAGAVLEVMPQKQGDVPSEAERKALKVIPPGKLAAVK